MNKEWTDELLNSTSIFFMNLTKQLKTQVSKVGASYTTDFLMKRKSTYVFILATSDQPLFVSFTGGRSLSK